MMILFMILKLYFGLIISFGNFSIISGGGKGGRAASKVGLVGIGQYSASSSSQQSSSESSSVGGSSSTSQDNRSAEKKLKNSLFLNNRYDKAIRPVRNTSNVVLVYVDFTYMQVLDLNEKDQTLTSLIRYRLYWKDEFLEWNPEEFDGIKDLWLPAHDIWLPDIVCYEETGKRDYNPRLPYLVVHYDGLVRYLEPTEYVTTCHVNISHFPFDEQICSLTFSSWTFPTSQVDLMAKRNEKSVKKDIPIYFADSGEWRLADITVSKMSQNFLSVLPDTKDSRNTSAEEKTIAQTQFFKIDPTIPVRDVAPSRVSNSHWSDVRFSLKFRRNSSLYVQSMLIPAILLTTISLIGFYLPPDSGERIGLQITILLTFMVFILTVGDMFPASTGPYLGVYFVLCMALLGLNIAMTVLVLYLHYIPISAVMVTDTDTEISSCNVGVLPLWVKAALALSGVYKDIQEFHVSPDEFNKQHSPQHQVEKEKLNKIRRLFKSISNKCSRSRFTEKPSLHSSPCNGSTRINTSVESCWGELREKNIKTTNNNCNGFRVYSLPNNEDTSDVKLTSPSTPISDKTLTESVDAQSTLEEDVNKELFQIGHNVSALIKHAEAHYNVIKNDNVESAMEEKWRWVARKVDMTCMALYIGLLIIFHIGIAMAIFLGN